MTSADRRDGVPRLALSPAEAAIALSVSERTLRALVDSGEIPHVRIARRIVIRVADLESFLESRRVLPDAEGAA